MSDLLNYMIGEAILNTKTGKSVSKQVVEQKKQQARMTVTKPWQADRKVFQKTDEERLKLKELKKQFKSGNKGFTN